MVAAEVLPDETFAIGEQRVLFSIAGFDAWDLSSDDQRFVMNRVGEGRRGHVDRENAFEELRGSRCHD